MHLVYLTNEEKKKITDGIAKATEDIGKAVNGISKLSEDIVTKASAIKGKVSGSPIVVTDSVEMIPVGLTIDGKSEQKQYSGNQLIDFRWRENSNGNGINYSVNDDGSVLVNGTPTVVAGFSLNITDKGYLAGTYFVKPTNITGVTARLVCSSGDGSTTVINGGSYGELADFNSYTSVLFQILTEAGTTLSNKVIYPMLNRGTSELPWEPYCGGQPSPNPSYPQEIVNYGVYDEASGKYKVTVKSVGKNVIENTISSRTVGGITYTKNDDGTVVLNGTATGTGMVSVFTKNKLKAGKYILSGCPSDGSDTKYFLRTRVYSDSKNSTPIGGFEMGSGIEIVLSKDTENISFAIHVANGTVCENVIFKPMLRLASVSDDTYEPYKETTAEILLDEPLRKEDKAYWNGGSKVRIDRYRDVKLANSAIDKDSSGKLFRIGVLDNAVTVTGDAHEYLNCEKYIGYELGVLRLLDGCGMTQYGNNLYIKDDNYSSVEEFSAHLAENPLEIEYTLATPITEEIDIDFDDLTMFYPTTILSNDGNANMEVEYVVDTKTYIDKKFAELAAAML